MPRQRKQRGLLEKDNERLGLMANGSLGGWYPIDCNQLLAHLADTEADKLDQFQAGRFEQFADGFAIVLDERLLN